MMGIKRYWGASRKRSFVQPPPAPLTARHLTVIGSRKLSPYIGMELYSMKITISFNVNNMRLILLRHIN